MGITMRSATSGCLKIKDTGLYGNVSGEILIADGFWGFLSSDKRPHQNQHDPSSPILHQSVDPAFLGYPTFAPFTGFV